MRLAGKVFAVTATAAVVLTTASCGGSSDDDATADGPDGETATDTTDVPETVPVAEDECEVEPDPDDYPEGQIPPIVRPCEEPVELTVHTIRSGTGLEATAGDTMIVDYSGVRAADGRLFDTSYTRGVPFDFSLGDGVVIPGLDDGLTGAQAGGLYKFDIPADLAYGDSPPPGSDVIEPGDALTFVVEVRAVIPDVSAADAPLDLDIEPSDGATELGVVDLVEGDGALLEAGDTAVIHMLLVRGDNEIVLFNTWEQGEPLQVVLTEGGSLPGIVDGLEGATVGTRRVITVPPEMAFGEDGNASLGLPAGRDLIVIADVVGAF